MSIAFPSLREHPPRRTAMAVAVIVVLLVWVVELLISPRPARVVSYPGAISRIIPDDGTMTARQALFRARLTQVTIAVNPVWTENGVDVAAASRVARRLAQEKIGRATALLAGAALANPRATGELRRQLRDRPPGADYVLVVDYTAARTERMMEFMLVDAAGEIVIADRFALPRGPAGDRRDSIPNWDEVIVLRIVDWLAHDRHGPDAGAPHRPSAFNGRRAPTPILL